VAANEPVAFREGSHGVGSRDASDVEGQEWLAFRLTALYKLISRQSVRCLGKRFGLSMAEWRVLVELGERSPRTLWQLVESIHADKAQLSRASASLLKKGFVRREPDPQDARSVLFSITPEGLAQKNAVMPTRRAFNQMLMEQLSEEEHLALSSALDTLTDFLNTDPKSL